MRKPVAIGIGAGALAILLISKSASAAEDEPPKKPRRVKPPKAIVAFTQRRVPWWSAKKKRNLWRTQVVEVPAELARAAGRAMGRPVSLDAFLLGTLVASEAEDQPDEGKVAIAYAALTMVKNLSERLGENVTLLRLLAPSKLGNRLGGQLGGYAATARPPTAHDVEIGEGVLDGRFTNPTPGALQWDSPAAQDKLVAKGAPGYDIDADDLARRRKNEGKVPVYLADVNPRNLRLWKPAA